MVEPLRAGERLLSPYDPAPAEVLRGASKEKVVLVCEHAGLAVPKRLGDLGLGAEDREKHIGWDIGAGAVARRMAEILDAPTVLQAYSRLVIDCNRPPDAPDAMVEISDGIAVPGNMSLGKRDRSARIKEVFDPFQAKVTALLTSAPRRAVFSIHSFTPWLGGNKRPWDVGFLFRADSRTSHELRRFLLEAEPSLLIGMNQPYQIDDASDWFVPHHGEAAGLAHSLIEIRNDLILDERGQARWADRLAGAITRLMKELPHGADKKHSTGS